jgi:hypothetical protein
VRQGTTMINMMHRGRYEGNEIHFLDVFLGIAVFSFFSTVMSQIDLVSYFHSFSLLMKLFDQTNNCYFCDEFLNSL